MYARIIYVLNDMDTYSRIYMFRVYKYEKTVCALIKLD